MRSKGSESDFSRLESNAGNYVHTCHTFAMYWHTCAIGAFIILGNHQPPPFYLQTHINTHTHIDAGFLRLQSCSSVSYPACSQGDGTKDGQMSCQGLQSIQLTHPQYQEPRNEAISHQFRSLSEDTEVLTDKELWFKQEVFVSCVSCDA